MIGVVVAAHGDLAKALVDAALLVVTKNSSINAVGITMADDSTSYEAKLREAISEVEKGQGVLILTDMFGGTPSNIGLTLHELGRVEVLTGANLPMVIRALQLAGKEVELRVAAREVKDYGERAIAVASEVLSGPANGQEKMA